MIEIPAKIGRPYEIGLTPRGLIRLAREAHGRRVHMVIDPDAAIRIADALVDMAEALN